MKVAVYAICKNEARFAARWMASMGEADGVYVLDTGSTDGTAERLRALGAVVAVEWSENCAKLLARESPIVIDIQRTGENDRRITVTGL